VLALLAAFTAAAPADAQIFLSSRPPAGLAVRPLFIAASVGPAAADVPLEIMFSLMVPPDRSALDFEQDIYLLWPGAIGGEPGPGFELPAGLTAHLQVRETGRVRLQARRHYETAGDVEVIPTGAPYITVTRLGGPVGAGQAATYVRVPWNPKLVNHAWLTSLHFTARDLVKVQPSTWVTHVLSGSRSTLALGFNDVGAPVMFSMYYWQRDNVLPVLSPARLEAYFARADHLAIPQMFPPAARREPSPSARTADVVSLFLTPFEGLAPQVLRVEFAYLSRLQSWGPILVPALFFALGNVAAVLLRNVADRMQQRLAGWLQLGRRRASAPGVDTGTVIDRDRLARIVPGETSYQEVLELCGHDREEREDFAVPQRRTLVYRGRRDVPHRRWAWSWLAAVSHWDVERHEVEITVENGVVQNLQVRVGRARHAQA
jgi:hypothetical protein